MCVLLIEVVFDALGLDVDSRHHIGVVDYLSGPWPNSCSEEHADSVDR